MPVKEENPTDATISRVRVEGLFITIVLAILTSAAIIWAIAALVSTA